MGKVHGAGDYIQCKFSLCSTMRLYESRAARATTTSEILPHGQLGPGRNGSNCSFSLVIAY